MLRAWLHQWDLRCLVGCLALLLASCTLEADTNTTPTEPIRTTVATTAAKTTSSTAPSTTIAPETSAPSMTFPITYAGPGTMTFSTDQMGAAGDCVFDQILTVTLLPDGTVEGTIDGQTFSTTIETVEGVATLVCFDGDDYAVPLVGTHDSGEVQLSGAETPDQPFLQGKYQPDRLTIEQVRMNQVTQDVTVTSWADYQFELPPQA